MHGVGEPVYEEGLVTRFVGTTLDITEQERLTQELHRQQPTLRKRRRSAVRGASAGTFRPETCAGPTRPFGFLSISER